MFTKLTLIAVTLTALNTQDYHGHTISTHSFVKHEIPHKYENRHFVPVPHRAEVSYHHVIPEHHELHGIEHHIVQQHGDNHHVIAHHGHENHGIEHHGHDHHGYEHQGHETHGHKPNGVEHQHAIEENSAVHDAVKHHEQDKHGYEHHIEDYYAHPKYHYEYKIEDPHTGDHKSQHEIRDGDKVEGHYSFKDADGSIRTVKYTSDKHTGFHAVVEKETKHGITDYHLGHH